MNVIADYKRILKGEYIDHDLIDGLGDSDLKQSILYLSHKIDKLHEDYGSKFEELFELMTRLYCYKMALKMKVTGSLVPDAKDPDNKYVQARGAVVGLNKKRMWISHYLGPEKKYTGNNGNLIPIRIIKDGRVPIVRKTIDKLLSQIDGL
jgi:hypothetical protein